MDSHTKTPSGDDLVEMIRKADRAVVKQNYYRIIKLMQERMSSDQEAFK